MIVLRKKIADGTALPEELAEFERTSKQRQDALDTGDDRRCRGAHQVSRRETLRIRDVEREPLPSGQGSSANMGYSAKDFHPDNCIYVGGLKRAQLPPDYQEFVHQTFNIPANLEFQNYSMQESYFWMPKVSKGRPLSRTAVDRAFHPRRNKEGDTLLSHEAGEIEGRVAFFDLSLTDAGEG